MDREIPAWVVVGTEMVEVNYNYGNPTFGAPRKIEKVYKTGRFTLEGSPQQYAPDRDRASRTGDTGRWSRSTFKPMSDELRADMTLAAAVRKARADLYAVAKHLEHLAKSEDTALASADLIAPILAAMAPAETDPNSSIKEVGK